MNATVAERIIERVQFIERRGTVTTRAADFLALQSALADCTPQGRHRAQQIRTRQNIVVAPASNPAPEQHAFDI